MAAAAAAGRGQPVSACRQAGISVMAVMRALRSRTVAVLGSRMACVAFLWRMVNARSLTRLVRWWLLEEEEEPEPEPEPDGPEAPAAEAVDVRDDWPLRWCEAAAAATFPRAYSLIRSKPEAPALLVADASEPDGVWCAVARSVKLVEKMYMLNGFFQLSACCCQHVWGRWHVVVHQAFVL